MTWTNSQRTTYKKKCGRWGGGFYFNRFILYHLSLRLIIAASVCVCVCISGIFWIAIVQQIDRTVNFSLRYWWWWRECSFLHLLVKRGRKQTGRKKKKRFTLSLHCHLAPNTRNIVDFANDKLSFFLNGISALRTLDSWDSLFFLHGVGVCCCLVNKEDPPSGADNFNESWIYVVWYLIDLYLSLLFKIYVSSHSQLFLWFCFCLK